MATVRTQTGNTFYGYIPEFPGLRVDRFDQKSCLRTNAKDSDVEFYLLTHAHADHLTGFDSSSFSGKRVYCSPITKKLLKQDKKYHKNSGCLFELTPNQRHEVPYKDSMIKITPLPSNHCPGSVMYLLEGQSKAVLLTGDIRAEKWWVYQLTRNPFLFPYTTGQYELDTIYLDTTYQYRDEPYLHMIQNFQGLQMLTGLLANYPKDDQVQLYYMDNMLGFEEVWAHMSGMFDGGIHSTREIMDRTRVVVETGGYEYGDQLVKTMTVKKGPRFHACGRVMMKCPAYDEKCFNVKVKGVIDVSYEELKAVSMPIMLGEGGSVPTGLKFLWELEGGHRVYGTQDGCGGVRKLLLPKGGDKLLPDEILYFFSRHSAYSECRRFVQLFNVKDVYPIVEDEGSWMERQFTIKRHFGDLLKVKTHRYDEECTKFYGLPHNVAPKTRPKVNTKQLGLDFDSIKNFQQSMNEMLKSSGDEPAQDQSFHIRGQQRMTNCLGPLPSLRKKRKTAMFHELRKNGDKLAGMTQYKMRDKIEQGGIEKAYEKRQQRKLDQLVGEAEQHTDNEDYDEMSLWALNEQLRREAEEKQRQALRTPLPTQTTPFPTQSIPATAMNSAVEQLRPTPLNESSPIVIDS